MTKVFRLEDLDCANCAAKMEHAITKIAAVDSAKVNFISQRMTIEAPEEQFPTVMEQVVRVCRKIEPDCKIIL